MGRFAPHSGAPKGPLFNCLAGVLLPGMGSKFASQIMLRGSSVAHLPDFRNPRSGGCGNLLPPIF